MLTQLILGIHVSDILIFVKEDQPLIFVLIIQMLFLLYLTAERRQFQDEKVFFNMIVNKVY